MIRSNVMDTYRVQLPHPQPIEREEEFVTSSGRKVKRPIVEHDHEKDNAKLNLAEENDVAVSGVSVLSPDSIDQEVDTNGQLSDSVQAELHLSLDRLSENFDAEERKRLQEKSRNNNTASHLSESKKLSNRANLTPHAAEMPSNVNQAAIQDSLDEEITERAPIPVHLDSETSEEFVVSGDEDDRTVVADSLNYQSFGEGVTVMSSAHSLKRTNELNKTPSNGTAVDSHDEYADLRYNPNFRQEQAGNRRTTKDSSTGHTKTDLEIADSLEEFEPEKSSGGAIVIHRKGLYSPVLPNWGKESSLKINSRSISPTRLSADPVKLQQTNALYEEEFNKMLRAEILDQSDELGFDEKASPHEQRHPPPNSTAPRTESYSVLIRKIEQQEKKSTAEEPIRIGGYQLLPDRHKIPSPGRGVNQQEIFVNKQQRTPKKIVTPRSYPTPEEYFYTGKKDPLVALSPREKKKVSIAPTPPKLPKPRDIDYIELNKQRLSRKTNSAGYLDLHRKRNRQVELLETRSQSEIKRSTTQPSPRRAPQYLMEEYPPDSVEGLWAKQVERLKMAKGQNLNQGKVVRQRAIPNGFSQGVAMDPSSADGQFLQYHTDRNGMQNVEWSPYAHKYSNAKLQMSNQQQISGSVRARPPLPVPSQTTAQYSPRHSNRSSENNEYGDDTPMLHQDAYLSPRMRPVQDQSSPLMRAYQARYATDVYQPKIINTGSGNVLRQNFNDRNIMELSQREHDVWMNPNNEQEFAPNEYIPHSNTKFHRRVTFLGDNQPIAIEGVNDELSSSISGSGYALNRYKIPLPPTPPSKSQRHSVQRARYHAEEKENDGGYYDAREEAYPVLPPILKPSRKSPLKQSPNRDNESQKFDNNGSYYEQYEKEKTRKKLQYKVYTLNDYKNLKKDVKLGGLGPDMGSAREKMQKVDRGKQYAELIRKEHMANGVIKQKDNVYETNGVAAPGFDEKHHFSATMDEKQRKEMLERRTRAIEYSKQVPKPKVKPSVDRPSQASEVGSYSSNYSPDFPSGSPREGNDINYGLLEMMKERHEKEKAQVAAFTG